MLLGCQGVRFMIIQMQGIDTFFASENLIFFIAAFSFHHNYFLFNNRGGVQAFDGDDNIWYDLSSNEGNYWSDYRSRYPSNYTGGYEIPGFNGKVDLYPLLITDFDQDGIKYKNLLKILDKKLKNVDRIFAKGKMMEDRFLNNIGMMGEGVWWKDGGFERKYQIEDLNHYFCPKFPEPVHNPREEVSFFLKYVEKLYLRKTIKKI